MQGYMKICKTLKKRILKKGDHAKGKRGEQEPRNVAFAPEGTPTNLTVQGERSESGTKQVTGRTFA